MMRIIIFIVWFLVFTKLFIFWVWLWQLKEYRWRRFKAHFGTQKIRKLFFSLKGIRYPKLTKKTIVILVSGILIEFLILFYLFFLPENLFYFLLLVLIILAPIIFSLLVLFFQIPTTILIKRTLRKAKEKREKFKDLLVIGITGSYGKTSTKEFLATILEEKYKVLKTFAHQNTDPAIARLILDKLAAEHQIFIVEMAAYGLGEIKSPCRMIQPKIGILTGINEQHLSTFDSQENIAKTKYELIENLPPDGLAIFNGANKLCLELCQKTKIPKKLSGGVSKSDIWAEDIKMEKEFVLFKVHSKDADSADFKVNLLGKHNIENILLAACCAKELGMTLEEISRACLKIKPEQGAMRILKKNDLTVLDASYSANPVGVIADLDYLKIYSGKKIIVMPCLIELGKESKQIHKRIGKKIAEVCDLAIITTKDYFKEIKKGTETGSLSLLLIENPREILKKLKEFSGKEDVILLEGRVPKGLIDSLK